MPEPDWVELLNAYYQNDGWMWRSTLTDTSYPELPEENNLYHYKDGDEEKGHFLEIENTLRRAGLVRSAEIAEIGTRKAGAREHVSWTKLTEKGFNVAHEREMVRYQNTTSQQVVQTNKRIAELTVVLAGAAVVQALASLFSANYIGAATLVQGIGATVILGILISIYILSQ